MSSSAVARATVSFRSNVRRTSLTSGLWCLTGQTPSHSLSLPKGKAEYSPWLSQDVVTSIVKVAASYLPRLSSAPVNDCSSQAVAEMATYKPLDSAAYEIRVLDIKEPSTTSDLVSCEFRIISLKADPVPLYETISYCWGISTERRDILLDGHLFSVPVNTESALRCMASGHGKRTVWIDAICINQNDINERQQQVAMMGQVYSLCQRTLVYLGQPGLYRSSCETHMYAKGSKHQMTSPNEH